MGLRCLVLFGFSSSANVVAVMMNKGISARMGFMIEFLKLVICCCYFTRNSGQSGFNYFDIS